MTKTLMVPVHVDALFLAKSEAAAEQTADFRGLPYYDSREARDVNSDTPWIGDSVVTPPFENSNMTLQAGVHLHWSLPDGLCRGKMVNGKIELPVVPNRWLIRRRDGKEDKCFVVESDYLWPPTDQAPAVNILHERSDTEGRPFRFLGRKLTWDKWVSENAKHEYLKPLTAIGHGEPTFAAFYPNCMTVFGFHDRDLPDPWETIQYDLLGWYGGKASTPPLSWDPDDEDPPSSVEPVRRWRIKDKQGPEQLLCYASIKLTNDGGTSVSAAEGEPAAEGRLKVAVGNTVTEALTALLANEVAEELGNTDLSRTIEEQLEALHIEGQLASESQDLGLRLRRYRHQKSFAPVPGTERWTVHASNPGASRLPEGVLLALRDLNEAQARHGRGLHELEHARRQLYGDWCNYMRCVYRPPDGGRGQFLDIDEVVAYIENRSLEKVERLKGIVEVLEGKLKEAESTLRDKLNDLNRAEEAKQASDPAARERPTQYALRRVPGARFWEPTDPVVLITGGKVQVSERHGRDGRHSADGFLLCETLEINGSELDAELRKSETTRDAILKWVEEYWEKNPPGTDGRSSSCIGFQEVNLKQRPWNPLFLDWGIDMHPAESRGPDAPGSYDPDVVMENYRLGAQSPDLQPENLYTHDDPDRFSGRCILGSTASVVLRERIEEVLRRRLLEGKPESWANTDSKDPDEVDYFGKVTDWYTDAGKPSDLPTTPAKLKALMDWYAKRPLRKDATRPDDPLYCMLRAYRKLFDNAGATDEAAANKNLRPRAFLGQALSGFNEELIQWKLSLTLPIDEPIGLTPYREFTDRVAKAVGDVTAWATEPTNNFSPIRSGALKLDKLRMLDSFGQVAEVPCDEKVIVPWPYRAPGRPGVAFLPPRLAQPAGVTFRWLDAHPDEEGEMVEEASRSPICGWLLPEKLSGRLLVFDGDGHPLGALAADRGTETLEWVRAPGLPRLNEAECDAGREWLKHVSDRYHESATSGQEMDTLKDLGELGASIKNPRLARVLLYLWATRSPEFLERFLHTLDDAMANIDPEGATSMGSTALLVGRPVAVVGAELNLVLKDQPAVRQDWAAFLSDQYRHRRDTDGFPDVHFPLRLGQYKSRNDGVLGFWQEEAGGFVDDTFVAQAADDDDPSRRLEVSAVLPGLKPPPEETEWTPPTAKLVAHQVIEEGRVDSLNFTQSVADPPLRATLLMDPRGRAHLTTGILPVKSIDIPRHLWEPSLEAIRVWFPTAPVLSRHGRRGVPTPTLVDRRWSWLELEKSKNGATTDVWQTLRSRPSVERKALEDHLSTLQVELQIGRPVAQLPDIPQLIEKGWLEKHDPPSNRLDLGAREDRQELDDRALEAPIDTLLAQLSLALVSPGDEPDFNPGVEVREGWLLLEPGSGASKA